MEKVFLQINVTDNFNVDMLTSLAAMVGGSLVNIATSRVHVWIDGDVELIPPDNMGATLGAMDQGSVFIWLPGDESIFVNFRREIGNVLTFYTDGFTPSEKATICSAVVYGLISDSYYLSKISAIRIFDDEAE